MYLIHLYHYFNRRAKTGDLDLYVSCLPDITNIFFTMNHLIYARWLVKCCDSLIKLPDTHRKAYLDFQNGWFGIKQTRKSFFSTPTDLTLEQTINADDSNQRFGIISVLVNEQPNICKKTESRISHFFNYNYIVIFGYARPKEKRRLTQYLRHGVINLLV